MRSLVKYLREKNGDYTPVGIAIAFALLTGALAFIAIVYFSTNSPQLIAIENDLKQESDSIRLMPEAFVSSHWSIRKPGFVQVYSSFETTARHSLVRAFYDVELPTRGWRLCAEEKIRNYGIVERGETRTIYCKGDYRISLAFHDENRTNGNGFSLRVEWEN